MRIFRINHFLNTFYGIWELGNVGSDENGDKYVNLLPFILSFLTLFYEMPTGLNCELKWRNKRKKGRPEAFIFISGTYDSENDTYENLCRIFSMAGFEKVEFTLFETSPAPPPEVFSIRLKRKNRLAPK